MRAAAIAVGVVLVLGLSACGGGDESSSTTTAAATTSATGTTAGGDAAAGREVFIDNGCGSCHTLEAAGTDGTIGPNLDQDLVLAAEAAGAPLADHVRTSIVDPDAWVMPRWSNGVMPRTFGSDLSAEELDDLVAFVVQSVQ